MKKTEFEKTLTIKQKMLWRMFREISKAKGSNYNDLNIEEKKQVEQAFLNECLKRRIY